MPDRRFADPTERKARKGNAKLGGGDIRIKMIEEIQDVPGAFFAFVFKLLHAGAANRDQCKFSCDEKTISNDKEEHGKERYAGTNWVLQAWLSTMTSGR
jgi:hypothetical protein